MQNDFKDNFNSDRLQNNNFLQDIGKHLPSEWLTIINDIKN